MADHSYFEFSCLCEKGHRVEEEGTLQCECGRVLVLDWSGAARCFTIEHSTLCDSGGSLALLVATDQVPDQPSVPGRQDGAPVDPSAAVHADG